MKLKLFIASSLAVFVLLGCGGGGTSHKKDSGGKSIQEKGIEASKDIFKELRTQAIELVDYNNSGNAGYFDTEAVNIKNALSNCSVDAQKVFNAVDDIMTTADETVSDKEPGTTNIIGHSGKVDVNCSKEENTSSCSYVYTYNGSTYTGNVVLFNYDIKDAEPGDEFHSEFHGKLPYQNEDNNSVQQFDYNITATKTEQGIDVNLSESGIEHDVTFVGISNLSVSVNEDDANRTYVQLHNITLNGQCSQYQAIGTIKIPEYVQDANNKWKPSELTFNGTLKNNQSGGSLTGNTKVNWLNAEGFDSDNDEMEFKVLVKGILKMPARPKTNLDITYTNKDLNEDVNYQRFTAKYSHDDLVINIKGNLDRAGKNGKIEISTNKDVKVVLIIENGDIVEGDAKAKTGSIVTYKGTLVGTFEYRNSILVVKYTNGDFESLP